LENETPGARQAEVVSFTVPLFHFGKAITGEIKVKNTAPANTSSGFTPKVEVRMWPFGSKKTITSPLIFAGNTRTIKLDLPSSQFGIYKITASHGSSQISRWVVVVTGAWRWILPAVILVSLGGFILYRYMAFQRRGKRP
jgi:hypothetical protein